MGLFCVVDLRAHPNENDKIRPNKNYQPEGPEKNAFIIYSDVVREPAPDMICEILPAALRDFAEKQRETQSALRTAEGRRDERRAGREQLPQMEQVQAALQARIEALEKDAQTQHLAAREAEAAIGELKKQLQYPDAPAAQAVLSALERRQKELTRSIETHRAALEQAKKL